METKIRKKLGIIVTIVGIVCVLLLWGVKEANKPIKVTSSFGTGYMGGLSSETVDALNMFIVIGVVDIIAGVALMLTAPKSEKETVTKEKITENHTQGAKALAKESVASEKVKNGRNVHIIFKLDDGKMIRLFDKSENMIEVGDEGVLTWCGDLVVFFDKEN